MDLLGKFSSKQNITHDCSNNFDIIEKKYSTAKLRDHLSRLWYLNISASIKFS